jgi:ubiquinone/menaquinone biosynthesis C-methylase UbiE|tara:strand:+ start:1128 stop:1805 length:678 start_codon:yes stop_codon:yes gene_type:complete
MSSSNFVNVTNATYPLTAYPGNLINYLIQRYKLKKKSKILEIGCGRGEFLNEFIKQGIRGYGVDISNYAQSFCPDAKITTTDLENEKLPYDDNEFDIIYSKSFIEHLYYPEKIFEESYRVLKPGGIMITLVPEYTYISNTFYDDYSHRTPWTKTSLELIQKVSNFKNIQVESFKQLPILWKSNPFVYILKLLSFLTRILIPCYFKRKSKWVRFSKEIMLLSTAYK